MTEHISRLLHMAELCARIGVTERILRSCCTEFLGIASSRYVLMRRLEQARRALRDADPEIVNVAEVAQRCGFPEAARFAAAYRGTFGETPSTTLRRVPRRRLTAH